MLLPQSGFVRLVAFVVSYELLQHPVHRSLIGLELMGLLLPLQQRVHVPPRVGGVTMYTQPTFHRLANALRPQNLEHTTMCSAGGCHLIGLAG